MVKVGVIGGSLAGLEPTRAILKLDETMDITVYEEHSRVVVRSGALRDTSTYTV